MQVANLIRALGRPKGALWQRLPLPTRDLLLADRTSTGSSSPFSSFSSTTYDYIVVGGGSAGCLIANRLSENPHVKVLLLEAGGDDRRIPFVHIPVGYLWSISNPRVDWCFQTEPVPGLHGRSLAFPRGKVLGGCSSINGMIYMRGQAEDYDGWAQIFAEDETRLGAKRANEKRKESAKDGENGEVWSWRGVLPGFTKSEDFAAGASIQEVERGSEGGDLYKSSPPKQEAMHGVGGEWRVEKQRLSWKVLDTFRDACEEQGIPKVEDFNRGNNFGSSYFHVNQRGGWRWNTSKAWLHPIMGRRANLTVLTHVHVLKVLLDKSNGSALGVEFARSEVGTGVVERAYAGLETILAAGAVGSPHLLQLSGVGPPAPLRSADVPVKHALSGVGANLQDHLQLRMVFRISGLPTLNEQYASWWGRVKMGVEYLWDRRGPLSMAPSQVGVFCKSEATLRRPDLEFHVQPLSLDRFGEPLHPFPAFTASVCHLQPTSRGSVLLRNRDPRAPPRIQPNYLATAKDRAVAARALRLTRRLVLGSRAFLPFKPEEYAPGITCQSQAELEDAAGKVGTTIFHPAGTCKMGRADDPLAVLDARLRVRGIERLRVCDTSAMPVITSGNTSSPTLMIAEKASDFLHAAHGTAADKP